MRTRRGVLASTAGIVAPLAAGCTGILDGSGERHTIDVLNGTDTAHRIAVSVFDEDSAVLFSREYSLEPGTGDENRILEGSPARVEVAVDGDAPVSFPWDPNTTPTFATNHPDGCPDGTTTSLTVRYGLGGRAEVVPIFGCETAA